MMVAADMHQKTGALRRDWPVFAWRESQADVVGTGRMSPPERTSTCCVVVHVRVQLPGRTCLCGARMWDSLGSSDTWGQSPLGNWMRGAAAEQLSAQPAREKSDSDEESKKGEESGFCLRQHFTMSQAESGSSGIFLILTFIFSTTAQ